MALPFSNALFNRDDEFVFEPPDSDHRGPALLRTDLWSAAKPDKTDGGGGGGGKPDSGGGGGGGGGKPDKGGGDTTPTDPGVLTEYTSGGDAATTYNVEIIFSGTWTTALQDAFIASADFISGLILGDVTDVIGGGSRIDDISIDASLIDIDGSGGVLGRAGPTAVRGGSYLPATAIMEFDVADAETYDGRGLWDDIILHEMLHSLGFGTMWSYMGLATGSVAGGDLRFTGDLANDFYRTEFTDIYNADGGRDAGIPIETDGGSGTAGGHWDELLFVGEIMTGYINGSNYLSTMSVAALEDMGYDTVLDDPRDGSDLSGPMPDDSYFFG
ncbi:leishmanolysin-related zinc metalloendopeptidase [Aestuariicoccus sp. MJ-SS9]|uniref:leishmanolysin-related zinc metalloendopeptidase n=1 Tax=Aestuariicoccus sp. MJ-SS9 TaxID=3079855 RepID=UPI0029091FFF|nr:leishmanolysin-related zinc metalloendopeptidase [Aestuariicoccus sp. MJ-SS9]MDU8910513.1 leishmanolysin-related zinc metalloendopeptidase [Aestuariicoccus sp. MJ-SS9]